MFTVPLSRQFTAAAHLAVAAHHGNSAPWIMAHEARGGLQSASDPPPYTHRHILTATVDRLPHTAAHNGNTQKAASAECTDDRQGSTVNAPVRLWEDGGTDPWPRESREGRGAEVYSNHKSVYINIT